MNQKNLWGASLQEKEIRKFLHSIRSLSYGLLIGLISILVVRNDRFVYTWVAELIFGAFHCSILFFLTCVFHSGFLRYSREAHCTGLGIAFAIFSDSIVFVATLSRTLVIYRRHRQGAAIPLIKIMMRDGKFRGPENVQMFR